MTAQFEADLEPTTGNPRMRFNFSNGWSASLLLRQTSDRATKAMLASVACWPTGAMRGNTELGPTEAFADEAIAWLDEVRAREATIIATEQI